MKLATTLMKLLRATVDTVDLLVAFLFPMQPTEMGPSAPLTGPLPRATNRGPRSLSRSGTCAFHRAGAS